MDWIIGLITGILVGLIAGLAFGITGERTYQCDRVGGELVGKVCIVGSHIAIDWR